MPILILLDLPRGAPSWVGQNITQTLSMDIAFAVSNLSQQTAHSLTVFGDNLVALEDRVLDVEKQKGLNFTKFIPIYDFQNRSCSIWFGDSIGKEAYGVKKMGVSWEYVRIKILIASSSLSIFSCRGLTHHQDKLITSCVKNSVLMVKLIRWLKKW